MPELPLSLFDDDPPPPPPKRRQRPTAPGQQLVITRPNGTVLVQSMPEVSDWSEWIERLAPLVPTDATWEVRPPGAPTPWDADRDAHA